MPKRKWSVRRITPTCCVPTTAQCTWPNINRSLCQLNAYYSLALQSQSLVYPVANICDSPAALVPSDASLIILSNAGEA